jgi:hypothetical protein
MMLNQIRLEESPTAFGLVSLEGNSKLGIGVVEIHVTPLRGLSKRFCFARRCGRLAD